MNLELPKPETLSSASHQVTDADCASQLPPSYITGHGCTSLRTIEILRGFRVLGFRVLGFRVLGFRVPYLEVQGTYEPMRTALTTHL